jgi:hypothetical protein
MFWIFFSVIPGGRQLRREIPLRPASAAARNLITAVVAIT